MLLFKQLELFAGIVGEAVGFPSILKHGKPTASPTITSRDDDLEPRAQEMLRALGAHKLADCPPRGMEPAAPHRGRPRGFSEKSRLAQSAIARPRRGGDRSHLAPRTRSSSGPFPRGTPPDQRPWRGVATGLRRSRHCRRKALPHAPLSGRPPPPALPLSLPGVRARIPARASHSPRAGLPGVLPALQRRALRSAFSAATCEIGRPALVFYVSAAKTVRAIALACFAGVARRFSPASRTAGPSARIPVVGP